MQYCNITTKLQPNSVLLKFDVLVFISFPICACFVFLYFMIIYIISYRCLAVTEEGDYSGHTFPERPIQ